jgi:hypothetical protein
MLEELGTFAEQDAAKEWTLVEEKPDLQFPALQLHGLTFSGIDINKDNLKGQLVVAIGRDPNTGHTVQNNTPNWHNHFGETAAFAIAETMRSALQNFSGAISPDSLQAPINNFFDAFKAALNDTLQSALRPIYAVERRSRLLWWKETLYSPYLKGSYRAVSAMVQPIVLAFDLFDLLPPVAPASVDYLLIDTLLLLNPNADEKMEIGDFLSALPKPECSSLPADILSNVQPEGDRISLTGFLGGLYKGKTKIADLKARTGIAGNSPISLAGLAINLLHDLMTERLITS